MLYLSVFRIFREPDILQTELTCSFNIVLLTLYLTNGNVFANQISIYEILAGEVNSYFPMVSYSGCHATVLSICDFDL